jgi:DNA-binding MarR family transcriptional regulator
VKSYTMSTDANQNPHLGDLLHHTAKVFSRWLDGLFEKAGVSPARARLIGTLHCSGSQTMAALAEALEVTPRNITGLVDGLEAEGLLARRADPTDRRATVIELTATGRRWADRHLGPLTKAVAAAFGDLSSRDRRELARLLAAVRCSVEQRSGDHTPKERR